MKLSLNIVDETKNERTRQRACLFCQQVFRALTAEAELNFLNKRREVFLGVAIVSRGKSMALNRRYRGKHKPANVLSFPVYGSLDALRKAGRGVVELGDIVVCPETIRKEARLARDRFYTQFFRMVLHGILHLLGYDHERNARLSARMEALENKVLMRFRG